MAPAAKGDAGVDDVGAGGEPSSEAKGAAVPGAGAGAGAGAGSSNNNDDEQDSTPAAEELTQEEVDRQVKSEPFKSFLGRASTVLERALGQASSFDIMVRGTIALPCVATAAAASQCVGWCRWTTAQRM